MELKSSNLRNTYKKWVINARIADIELVDAIYHECETNYDNGGDTIVECFTPDEIIAEFNSVDDARKFCGLKVEQALNTRCGEGTDPELNQWEKFKEWSKPKGV